MRRQRVQESHDALVEAVLSIQHIEREMQKVNQLVTLLECFRFHLGQDVVDDAAVLFVRDAEYGAGIVTQGLGDVVTIRDAVDSSAEADIERKLIASPSDVLLKTNNHERVLTNRQSWIALELELSMILEFDDDVLVENIFTDGHVAGTLRADTNGHGAVRGSTSASSAVLGRCGSSRAWGVRWRWSGACGLLHWRIALGIRCHHHSGKAHRNVSSGALIHYGELAVQALGLRACGGSCTFALPHDVPTVVIAVGNVAKQSIAGTKEGGSRVAMERLLGVGAAQPAIPRRSVGGGGIGAAC